MAEHTGFAAPQLRPGHTESRAVVRAFLDLHDPANHGTGAWSYAIWVTDQGTWTGRLGLNEAQDLLIRVGYSDNAAPKLLARARRRHPGYDAWRSRRDARNEAVTDG